MKKNFLTFICFSLLLTGIYAETLTVEKKVGNKEISIGDDIELFLEITNPFQQDVKIELKDKNVIANNGLDIQCYELTLPASQVSKVGYEPIKAFKKGSYKLEKAELKFTNPETGKEENTKSNRLKIDIKDSTNNMSTQQHGITTIYQCGGTSMKSTSYSSSSGNFQFNFNQGSNQQQKQNTPSVQQSNQDMQTLKNQLQEQMKNQEQMKEDFKNNLENNGKFQELEKQLKEKGYESSSKNTNHESEETGSFNYEYQNSNGERATISGEMKDGNITQMEKWDQEDQQRLQETLENSKEFQKMENKINQTYQQTNKTFNQPSQNTSTFNYTYQNEQGEKKSITGEITKTGNITSIKLEGGNKKKMLWYFTPLIIVLMVVTYFIYKRYFKKKEIIPVTAEVKDHKPIDYVKESLKILKKAEKEFKNGRKKYAYILAAKSLKFYFKYKLESEKDGMTTSEIIRKTRGTRISDDIKVCLGLCDMVKFAKYKSNKKDFNRVVKLGEKIITSG